MVFMLVGVVVGLGMRAFSRGWSQASWPTTLATLGVAAVGALLGAMFASALPFDVDFLSVHSVTLAGAGVGAFALLAMLGAPHAPEPTPAVRRTNPQLRAP